MSIANNRVVIELDGNGQWALGYDQFQWVLLRRAKRKDEWYWQPRRYVGSTKSALLRVFAENGICLTPVATRYLGNMQSRFSDWKTGLARERHG